MKTIKNLKKGFTLIELLVVIAIIGIMSSVVLASLNSARKKERDARRLVDIGQVKTALDLYFDANDSVYPPTVADLVLGGQIQVEPKDPVSGESYSYAALNTDSDGTTCESYHLGATLEESSNPALPGVNAPDTEAVCAGSALNFNGTDVLIYDVKP